MIAIRSSARLTLAVVLVGAMLAPPGAPAAPIVTAEQRCAAFKLDATARAVVAELGCQARALRPGAGLSPACVARADAALAAAFARIERRGGCAFVGDLPDVGAIVDAVVGALVTTLGADPPLRRCAVTKLRAAGRRAFRELACQRQAVRLGTTIDVVCRDQATARFIQAFASAERRLACEASGDAGAVLTMVAGFAQQVSARILGGPPAPDPKPSNLVATVTGGQIHLVWVAPPVASGNTHVRLLRRLNAPPVDATDPLATPIFFGTAPASNDDLTALLPDTAGTARVYHYAVFGCTAAGVCESVGSRTSVTPTLVQALRAGGYVLHWRHSAATVCVDQTGLGTAATTMSPDWWKSCDDQCPPGGMATARQLDATGVMEATAIGQALDACGIPIGRVLSSEFCRNVGTAELMDFGPTIEQRQEITFFVYDEAARCTNSYALIAEVPAPGTNSALIGHAGFSCAVLGSLAWSEAAIFKPDGAGGSELVTRVLWDAWSALP